METILQKVTQLQAQVEQLSKNPKSTTTINNNITNNNTMNVIINNYNQETYTHLTVADVIRIVTPYVKQWNHESCMRLTEDWGLAVYATPANRNIKCRKKDGQVQVFIDGEWTEHCRRDKTIEVFNSLTRSLKELGSEKFEQQELSDTDVLLQCVITHDTTVNEHSLEKDKDSIVCDIVKQCKVIHYVLRALFLAGSDAVFGFAVDCTVALGKFECKAHSCPKC
eukprot:2705-Heterococcus_DN1.PRE.8